MGLMPVIIYYDSNTVRQIKNAALMRPELDGSALQSVGRVKDFLGEPGAEALAIAGGYARLIINALDPKYQGLLETAVLAQMERGLEKHPNIILIGGGLEHHVKDYGVQVIPALNGYLQQHNLPQLRQALKNIGAK